MPSSVPFIVGLSFLLHLYPVSGRTFGTTFDPKTPSQKKGLYLNLQSPAPSDGFVAAWSYCYHNGKHLYANEEKYTATIMLYRQLEKSSMYVLVPESQVLLSVFRSFNESVESFKCVNTTGANLPVKKGDVIGACITAPNGLYVLDEGSLGHSVYAVTNGDGQCSLPPGIDVSPNGNSVQLMDNMAFHVTAHTSHLALGDDVISIRKKLAAFPANTITISSNLPIREVAGTVVLAIMVISIGVVFVTLCMSCHKTTASADLEKSKVASENEYGESKVCDAKPNVKSKVEALEYEIALNSIEAKRHSSIMESGHSSSLKDCSSKKQTKSLDSYYSTPTLLAKEKAQKHTSCISEEQTPYYVPANDEENLSIQLEKQGIKTIQQEEIIHISFLGSGQFGTVNKAMWNGRKGTMEVAVKTLKQASKQDRIKFLQEAAIMGQFRHPNIVTLYGLVTTPELMLVVEFISRGDLKTHLMSMNTSMHRAGFQVTNRLLLSFAQQIALGMNYLARKGFIHRDLAARNILVSEKDVCKIADFGLSRDLQDENCYISHGGKIPVKWTSPEAICFNKYSTASDVWSYGCVLYELWSLGDIPFSGFENRKVVEVLKTGYRLSPPTGCPRAIYEQMMKCWHPEPDSRPTFTMILLTLFEYEKHIRTVQTDDDIIHKQNQAPSSSENEYLELQQWYAN